MCKSSVYFSAPPPFWATAPSLCLLWQRQCVRDGTCQDFLDPTGKSQNLRRLTSQSTVVFLQGFAHCSVHLMKNIQKGRGGMGKVLKLVSEKKTKKFCVFFKNYSILRPF